MGAPDHCAHGVKTDVVFPSGVPYERLSIEPEGGNSVTETLDGTWCGGANGLA
jgi:hypothetical protein